MHRPLAILLFLGICLPFCGCSCSDDPAAYAIKRRSDDDDDEVRPAPRTPRINAADRSDGGAGDPAAPLDAARQTGAAEDNGRAFDETALPPPIGPPALPLSITERRQRTLNNLERIGQALARYMEDKNTLPPAYHSVRGGPPLLSWRVALLPYLGHGALYLQFRLHEPWNSPHNRQLLKRIPPEYVSPERFDESTVYLAPVGSSWAFQGDKPVTVHRIEDGVESTIVVVEANNEEAVEWTKPSEYEKSPANVLSGLGKLRQDGFFVVWGNGEVGRIPANVKPAEMTAMLTVDAGEPSPKARVARLASVEPERLPSTIPGGAADPVGPANPPRSGDPAGPAPDRAPVAGGPGDAPAAADSHAADTPLVFGPDGRLARPEYRHPVPSPEDQEQARALFREVYRQRIDQAKRPEEKEQLAKDLLADYAKLSDDPAGRFVLLGAVRSLAIDGGSAEVAFDAVERMAWGFDVDPVELRLAVLKEVAQKIRNSEDNKLVFKYAMGLMMDAYARDDYDRVEEMYDLVLAAARRTRDEHFINEVAARRKEITTARVEFEKAQAALNELGDDLENPGAKVIVGRYFCFVKQEWDRGLPLLAEGNDLLLSVIAREELANPEAPSAQVELAEKWWGKAEENEHPHKRSMHLRAAHWYTEAAPSLAEGLLKIKVENRLREAERLYGREAVPQVRQTRGVSGAAPGGGGFPPRNVGPVGPVGP